jgi:hypothetical protein
VEYAEAVRLSGLPESDFAFALQYGAIQPEACPFSQAFIPLYFDPARVRLSEDVLQEVWSKIQLNRAQAAQLLGVSVPIFERLRRRAGIRHVGVTRTDSGQRDFLYRKSDVQRLKGQIG